MLKSKLRASSQKPIANVVYIIRSCAVRVQRVNNEKAAAEAYISRGFIAHALAIK